MTAPKATARRKREPGKDNANIYRRYDGLFEVGIRDSAGRMIYPGPFKTVTAARTRRNEIKGKKANGERVQPNAKLKFSIAADSLLDGPAKHLRPATQAAYRNAIDNHLRKPWGQRQLSSIKPADVAELVKELRKAGKAEWTISQIVRTASRVFTHAQRRCEWHGVNPCAQLEQGERPRPADTAKRRIFTGEELSATLAAAHEPYRLLFTLAAVTGARLSELLGLTWADVDLADVEGAEVRFAFQLARGKDSERVDLKTAESRRTVELPHQLAALLISHRDLAHDLSPTAYVFATRSGRAIGHRNVTRELHRAMQKATNRSGELVFPVLNEKRPKIDGKRKPLPRGEVPTFHSFRHTAASEAIAAGESVEEVSWQLGHKSSVVTRAIYVQEVKSAEKTARRRSKMEARLGSILEEAERAPRLSPDDSEVRPSLRIVAA